MYGKCLACGRPLKSKSSRQRGYGPDCFKKKEEKRNKNKEKKEKE